jgi:hypothetical protein
VRARSGAGRPLAAISGAAAGARLVLSPHRAADEGADEGADILTAPLAEVDAGR